MTSRCCRLWRRPNAARDWSPLVGRLNDIGQDGFQIVEQMVQILRNHDWPAQVLVASVRKFDPLAARRRIGAQVARVPFSLLGQILHHPLTDQGLDPFPAHRRKTSHERLVAALPETVSRRRRGTEQNARDSEPHP
jgi:transaldolase